MLAILTLPLALAAQPDPAPRGWASLSIHTALSRTLTTYRFGSHPDGTTWVYRAFTGSSGGPVLSWADGRTCPGVERAVAALRELPPVRPRIPPENKALEIIMDGASYVLEVESSYGTAAGTQLRVQTNVGTPLAEWANLVGRELKPCWSATRPS